jgi:hypothetical protein
MMNQAGSHVCQSCGTCDGDRPSRRRFLGVTAGGVLGQCTKHGSKYTPEGVYMSCRATRNLDRFPIKRDGNQIVVDLDHMIQSDKDPIGWANAAITVA